MNVILLLVAAATLTAAGPGDYRTGAIDPRVRQVSAPVQQGVFTDPERYVGPLVEFLTEDAKDDYHKVKLIHDWLADNIAYDVDSYFSGATAETSPDAVLESRKSVCHGYAGLFDRMCSLAGVRSQRIRGHGRGYSYVTGRGGGTGENHAWNAVHLGGRWHLVDVTWDAGNVEGRAYKKQYGTTYLFMEPGQFVYTHLPGDPEWQLLEKPLTADEFAAQPYVRGVFFEHGLRLVTRLGRVSRARESVQFTIEAPPDVDLMAELQSPDGAEQPGRTLLRRDGRTTNVLVTFPRAGRWRVQLFSKPQGRAGSLSLAARLEFDASAGTPRTFPKTYGGYGDMRGYLAGPLYVPVATGRPVTFKVRLHGAGRVALAVGDAQWQDLAPVDGEKDTYQLSTSVPPNQRVRLNASRSTGGGYTTILDFTPGIE